MISYIYVYSLHSTSHVECDVSIDLILTLYKLEVVVLKPLHEVPPAGKLFFVGWAFPNLRISNDADTPYELVNKNSYSSGKLDGKVWAKSMYWNWDTKLVYGVELKL